MNTVLINDLRNGVVDPEKALEKFDLTARHIGEGELSDLIVKTLDCGFESLNDYMAFKKNGELIIVGARPSMGKSSFLLQIGGHVATYGNALFFSLEMSYVALKRRLIAMYAGRSIKAIQRGIVKAHILAPSLAAINKLNLFIEDAENYNINEIRNKAVAFNQHRKLDLVVVDYLQKIGARGSSRTEEIKNVTIGLKQLAMELGCPVLAAAQLNRSCEARGKDMESRGRRPDYRPMGSDLGESDKIQHIADVILFLSREEVYNNSRRGEVDVGVYKNRDGRTGWETFKWIGASTKFVDTSKDSL